MTNSKFISYLEYFYAYNKIPITCIKKNKLIFTLPKKNKLLPLINELYYQNTQEKEVSLTYHFDSLFLGKIIIQSKNSNFDLIIGPVLKNILNIKQIEKILNNFDFNIKEKSIISDELLVSNPVYYEEFINLLLILNFSINGSTLNEYNIISNYSIEELDKMKSMNPSMQNNDIFFEKLENFVLNGDQLGFITFSNFYPNKDLIFDDINEDLPSFKSYIIYYLSVISTFVSDAGIDNKTISRITKKMINKLNKTKTYKEAETIFNKTLKIFFNKINYSTNSKYYSNIVKMAISYIDANIESKLQVSDIALKLNVTRNYLSKCFKNDTGITIQQYIINSKLNQAKKLLETTNLTVTEISKKLYFSNQSHFQNTFKKNFEMTPIQYRIKHQKIK